MDVPPQLPRPQLSSYNYSYVFEEDQPGFRIITRHHVIVRRNWMLEFLLRCAVFMLMACTCTLLSSTVAQGTSFIGTCILCILAAAVIHRNGIQQESVVVMPTLGVQLETYYKRNFLIQAYIVCSQCFSPCGKVFRRFVPMGNILAAVINEAVTPFTCYWYLALVVREERKLVLVFQGLRPPLDMLVPIWKSLCSAIGSKMLQQSTDGS